MILVDIPIGLPDGPDERTCDQEARKLLGWPRRNSVFRVPVRDVLAAKTYAEACKTSRKATANGGGKGKGVTKQSFALAPKIAEVDDLLRACAKAHGLVREIHPEVCFAGLAGCPMKHGKKKAAGFKERRAVLQKVWPDVGVLIDDVLNRTLRKCVARDDVLDAAVAAWTACQPETLLQTLPAVPAEDAHGLPMEMVYAAADRGCVVAA